ncbi:arginyltransferase 1 isoform X2 [Haematobia irritans]|uniref:Arginyl-tRNA--protein transferase 1 n=1 Tax=Haematobia irritans TaxID=7368 RepID=A0A1L8EDK9_HAEIR
MDFTIIDYYGPQKSRCGYCKGVKCSISSGMHAYTMTPKDYQDLIDRGWRRSGHYCYKQDNTKTCCPSYTIKCDVLNFKMSKSHKKIIKRMNRFLRDGKRDKNEEVIANVANSKTDGDNIEDGSNIIGDCSIRDEVQAPNIPLKDVNVEAFAKANEKDILNEEGRCQPSCETNSMGTNNNKTKMKETPDSSKKSTDYVNPPCKKAKQMRLERKLAKQAAKGLPTVVECKGPKNQEKSLKEFLNASNPDDKHKLKIILVPANKNIYTDTAFALYRKYQLTIHNDNPERLQPKQLQRFCYNSPLKLSKPSDGPSSGYGSFHQQYYLDDQLIAVAVIDILPYCVSSVYFFYDPDYSFLSLGTYSSLREIELVQDLARTVPALKYYYMGFYIHSCPKMRYKGKLSSSYLLCPEAYTWHPLTDEIRLKLDTCKYQRFNEDPNAKDDNEFKDSDMDLVLLMIDQRTYVKYRQYREITGTDDRDLIFEYGKLVGKPLAHRMLYVKM